MTKQPVVPLAVLLLNAVGSLVAFALVAYSFFGIKPPATDRAAELANLQNSIYELGQTSPIKIKKMIINLYSLQTRLRYLSIEMDILPFNSEQKETLRKNEHIIRDTAIGLAGSMSPNELSSLSGKIILEERIKKTVNAKLGEPTIKKIFFSSFIIQ